jgi:uncharacterized protein (TIGR03083 family)
VETATYLGHLAADGAAALGAGRDQLDAPVPSCPTWTVADLLSHLGRVHRWVEEMVRTKAGERGRFPKPPPPQQLPVWYQEGLAMLLRTLEQADPDEMVWNWMALAPAPARFWPRRMAHETAVHRWDAENAVADAHPIDQALALDGIEEYLDIVSFILEKETPNPALSGRLGLQAIDAPFACTVTMSPTNIERADGLDHPQATVRAAASDLLLWLCGRRAAGKGGVAVEGDLSVAERWTAIQFE